jgi:nucleotide-binding universal stress UspA family protein
VEGVALEPSEMHALSVAGVDVAETPVEDESLAPSDLPSDSSPEREARRLTGYLEKVAARLRATGLVVNTHVASGDPADEIVIFGAQLGAPPSPSRQTLIVMATHGTSRLQRLWSGSVALRVMQQTELPVLLVRLHEPALPDGADH